MSSAAYAAALSPTGHSPPYSTFPSVSNHASEEDSDSDLNPPSPLAGASTATADPSTSSASFLFSAAASTAASSTTTAATTATVAVGPATTSPPPTTAATSTPTLASATTVPATQDLAPAAPPPSDAPAVAATPDILPPAATSLSSDRAGASFPLDLPSSAAAAADVGAAGTEVLNSNEVPATTMALDEPGGSVEATSVTFHTVAAHDESAPMTNNNDQTPLGAAIVEASSSGMENTEALNPFFSESNERQPPTTITITSASEDAGASGNDTLPPRDRSPSRSPALHAVNHASPKISPALSPVVAAALAPVSPVSSSYSSPPSSPPGASLPPAAAATAVPPSTLLPPSATAAKVTTIAPASAPNNITTTTTATLAKEPPLSPTRFASPSTSPLCSPKASAAAASTNPFDDSEEDDNDTNAGVESPAQSPTIQPLQQKQPPPAPQQQSQAQQQQQQVQQQPQQQPRPPPALTLSPTKAPLTGRPEEEKPSAPTRTAITDAVRIPRPNSIPPKVNHGLALKSIQQVMYQTIPMLPNETLLYHYTNSTQKKLATINCIMFTNQRLLSIVSGRLDKEVMLRDIIQCQSQQQKKQNNLILTLPGRSISIPINSNSVCLFLESLLIEMVENSRAVFMFKQNEEETSRVPKEINHNEGLKTVQKALTKNKRVEFEIGEELEYHSLNISWDNPRRASKKQHSTSDSVLLTNQRLLLIENGNLTMKVLRARIKQVVAEKFSLKLTLVDGTVQNVPIHVLDCCTFYARLLNQAIAARGNATIDVVEAGPRVLDIRDSSKFYIMSSFNRQLVDHQAVLLPSGRSGGETELVLAPLSSQPTQKWVYNEKDQILPFIASKARGNARQNLSSVASWVLGQGWGFEGDTVKDSETGLVLTVQCYCCGCMECERKYFQPGAALLMAPEIKDSELQKFRMVSGFGMLMDGFVDPLLEQLWQYKAACEAALGEEGDERQRSESISSESVAEEPDCLADIGSQGVKFQKDEEGEGDEEEEDESKHTEQKKSTYVFTVEKTDKVQSLWNDKGLKIWAPVCDAGYVFFGHCCTLKSDAAKPSIIVARKTSAVFAAPKSFEEVGVVAGTGSKVLHFWKPVPPADYVCLGYVCTVDDAKPRDLNVACVPADCVELLPTSSEDCGVKQTCIIDRGVEGSPPFSVWHVIPSNTFIVGKNPSGRHTLPPESLYKLKATFMPLVHSVALDQKGLDMLSLLGQHLQSFTEESPREDDEELRTQFEQIAELTEASHDFVRYFEWQRKHSETLAEYASVESKHSAYLRNLRKYVWNFMFGHKDFSVEDAAVGLHWLWNTLVVLRTCSPLECAEWVARPSEEPSGADREFKAVVCARVAALIDNRIRDLKAAQPPAEETTAIPGFEIVEDKKRESALDSVLSHLNALHADLKRVKEISRKRLQTRLDPEVATLFTEVYHSHIKHALTMDADLETMAGYTMGHALQYLSWVLSYKQLCRENGVKAPALENDINKWAVCLMTAYRREGRKRALGWIDNILKEELAVTPECSQDGIFSTNGPTDMFEIVDKAFMQGSKPCIDHKLREEYIEVVKVYAEVIQYYQQSLNRAMSRAVLLKKVIDLQGEEQETVLMVGRQVPISWFLAQAHNTEDFQRHWTNFRDMMMEKGAGFGDIESILEPICDRLEDGFLNLGMLATDVLAKVACKYARAACDPCFKPAWMSDTKTAVVTQVVGVLGNIHRVFVEGVTKPAFRERILKHVLHCTVSAYVRELSDMCNGLLNASSNASRIPVLFSKIKHDAVILNKFFTELKELPEAVVQKELAELETLEQLATMDVSFAQAVTDKILNRWRDDPLIPAYPLVSSIAGLRSDLPRAAKAELLAKFASGDEGPTLQKALLQTAGLFGAGTTNRANMGGPVISRLWKLSVMVERAFRLNPACPEVFVTLCLLGSDGKTILEKVKTPNVRDESGNPLFKHPLEKFQDFALSNYSFIKVEVWAYNKYMTDAFLGQAMVSLDDVCRNQLLVPDGKMQLTLQRPGSSATEGVLVLCVRVWNPADE